MDCCLQNCADTWRRLFEHLAGDHRLAPVAVSRQPGRSATIKPVPHLYGEQCREAGDDEILPNALH
jgi:hypothetical protein